MTQPPIAPRRPVVHRLHGIERIDDYDWMRDPEAARETLLAERRHYAAETAHLAPFRQVLAAKMAGRTPETESSVSWRHGAFVYYTQIETGREFGDFCRKRDASDGGSVLLNLDELAAAGYVELGVREVSPCGRFLAYSVDTSGDEVYELRFRDLETGVDLPDRVAGTYYTGAWSADSSSFFYTVVDECYRPYEVRRHVLGGGDAVVLTEPDRRFEVTVEATRSGAYIAITAANRDTTEVWLIPAATPEAESRSVRGRTPRVEYRVDHDATNDRLVITTDDGWPEFRVDHELVTPNPAERVYRTDCFAGYIVISLRRGGEPLLRVVPMDGTEPWEIHPETTAGRIALVHNHDYDTTEILIETGSYSEPTRWSTVDLATRERTVLKTAETPGYDPAGYVSERHWAPAPDGVMIPVTVVRRRDVPLDGTAPCLLYGYGAYEAVFDFTWEAPLSVLLDEGVIFAHAHIRGGGEMGRAWWQSGRLTAKPTTFSDHVAVAAWLEGKVTTIATRGLSAGGLLMAAVYGMRPWAAVIAEVPFVDVVTTMLDDTIPLTVNEWEEWGDPRKPKDFASMLAYSPYDNMLIPETKTPLLVTGAVNDPRVLVREPAKWVAKLRAHGANVLFRVEVEDGGHTGPSGRYAHLDYEAEIYAFILRALQQ
ncbi:S9 family peptidase [Acrocarpospora macrocephala]|uniref:S9 family peptidase n=1 Tax=Acrocarpospora macrocephala TaxID=150177 RepID=UPI0012D34512|nr:prolyl oligopeptidase family serine peptidase [Acrocarpospora macrocephala]